jgi:endonuclease YncB( thermonuclease family)
VQRLLISIIFLFLVYTDTSPADNKCSHDNNTFRCVKYLRNYDADTITFNIPNIHPLIGQEIAVRVNGVDTAELRTKDKCEKKVGIIARDFVTGILKKAKRIDLINISRGKYFRIVADVIIDDKSLSKVLLDKFLAYPYDGGTKIKQDWCSILKNNRIPATKQKGLK